MIVCSYRICFLLEVPRCTNEHIAVLAVDCVAEAAIRDVMLSIVWSEGVGIQASGSHGLQKKGKYCALDAGHLNMAPVSQPCRFTGASICASIAAVIASVFLSWLRSICHVLSGICAPVHCTASPPAAHPARQHCCRLAPHSRPARNAPQNASPAPTLSIAWTPLAGQVAFPVRVLALTPSAPSVNTVIEQY